MIGIGSGSGYSQRSRLDKLGVKATMRVAVLRLRDAEFLAELGSRTDDVVTRQPRKQTEMVFYLVERTTQLDRLRTLRSSIRQNGAIWVLWRKGRTEVKQHDVMAAAKGHGLVDIKVASFSDELSALKLVIPLAART